MSPLVAATLVALSAIYTWTDQDGVEHFTDDPTRVPKGVKARKTEGDEVSTLQGPVKPVQPLAAPRPQAAPVLPAQPAVPTPSEQYWREAFRAARTRVSELEDEIDADKKVVEEVNGLPQTARFSCLPGWGAGGPGVSTGSVTVTGQPVPGWTVNGSWTGTTGAPVAVVPGGCFASPNPEWERRRERLERNRRALVRAKEDLAELERRASFEAVPLHWRR